MSHSTTSILQSEEDLDTSKIRHWRSILTLIVFVFTNIIVLFPFHIPIFIPRPVWHLLLDSLRSLRVIPSRRNHHQRHDDNQGHGRVKGFVRWNFPMNFVTAPLIADLFLLAILAIGRKEVHDGTLGANNISPIDIMLFFITLAYIAISIDASGLIRYLAFKVLQKGGKVGHRLFFYLYVFFFSLGSFIGNDPIILSGTAFLAYMTRVSSNILHPRAWIHTQFAVANIASAILVSSNPTNLVLAGAFKIKFIVYTANMIVPVVITAIILFPFLLYVIFADESLIPFSIEMRELSEEAKAKKPVNPNIPNARGIAEDGNPHGNEEKEQLLSLEEIMNPFLDKGGATCGAVVMTVTLATLLALNAASQRTGEHPVFWVTLPAAFVMFCWDVGFGWIHRHETRQIARDGRLEVQRAQAERAMMKEEGRDSADPQIPGGYSNSNSNSNSFRPTAVHTNDEDEITQVITHASTGLETQNSDSTPVSTAVIDSSVSTLLSRDDQLGISQASTGAVSNPSKAQEAPHAIMKRSTQGLSDTTSPRDVENEKRESSDELSRELEPRMEPQPANLVSIVKEVYRWLQETFPTVTAVIAHLPFALVPFAFAMFVLVQALVTNGWVPVFAYGWDHWVKKTGTLGAIGGMGFLSVILCNFAGTNIGTTILLSRIIQAWVTIHTRNEDPISNRTFWATVYSMALGVNYGAFSTAFSASLAGLLWRDILARKHIHVQGLDFARVNLPIIAIAMIVGCVVLVGEVYIVRDNSPYMPPS